MTIRNYVGLRFDRLVVVDQRTKRRPSGASSSWAICQCDCGIKLGVWAASLVGGNTKSCGCRQKEVAKKSMLCLVGSRYTSLVGNKYGRLKVISHFPGGRCGCQCICGEICFPTAKTLKRGHTRSCGCLRGDTLSLGAAIRQTRDQLLGITIPAWAGRVNFKYRVWRSEVLKRDGRICQLCGGPGNVADHLKRFKEFPELRYESDNGRTLCQTCHRKTPTYGNQKQKA